MVSKNDVRIALGEGGVLSAALRLMIQLPESELSPDDRSWVEGELGGYADSAELSPNRIASLESRGLITNGTIRQDDVRIDGRPLPAEIQRWCDAPIRIREGVAEIEDLLDQAASDNSTLAIQWPPSAIELLNIAIQDGKVSGLSRGIRFISARKEMPRGMLIQLLEQIRIEAFRRIHVQRDSASEGQVGASEVASSNVNNSTVVVNGNENQIIVQSPNSSQFLLMVETGDIESLRSALLSLKVPNSDIDELVEIVEADSDETNRLKRSMDWVKRQAASLPIQVGTGILTTVVLRFLGLA
jgi:hypothetical protein